MSEELYHFYCLDLTDRNAPTVCEAHSPLRGKKASYKELRRLAGNAQPNQAIIMRLPSGALRTINPKGEVAMLKKEQSAQTLLPQLPAA